MTETYSWLRKPLSKKFSLFWPMTQQNDASKLIALITNMALLTVWPCCNAQNNEINVSAKIKYIFKYFYFIYFRHKKVHIYCYIYISVCLALLHRAQ